MQFGYDYDLAILLAKYAEELNAMKFPLDEPEFVELLYGHICNIEDAVLITLNASKLKLINNSTNYFTAVLRNSSRFNGVA